MRDSVLYVICPCFNEEDIIDDSAQKLNECIQKLKDKALIAETSKIVLIDDGSSDGTWLRIQSLVKESSAFKGIKLSKNFGQYAALMAGYMYAKDNADICISLDIDLQDDISVMEQMIKEYHNGVEVVLAIRSSRKTDSLLKKWTAKLYYKTMKLCGSNMIPEHPDYRLLSKKALEALALFKDKKPYIRGIIPNLGFKTAIVPFERHKRMAGTSCYSYFKLVKIAINGIIKTSNKLLQFTLFPLALSVFGLLFRYPIRLNWLFLFMSIWIISLYISDLRDQIYDFPAYIIDEIIE